MTAAGLENPTLHVHPGDHLLINVTNNTPETPVEMQINPPNCGDKVMTHSSVNLHYHGTNTSLTCGQDLVIQTLINSGHSFRYNIALPSDEPPGLLLVPPACSLSCRGSPAGRRFRGDHRGGN
jgi:FtsP/CotA-like multicopper oxidase with cupredoxin domain